MNTNNTSNKNIDNHSNSSNNFNNKDAVDQCQSLVWLTSLVVEVLATRSAELLAPWLRMVGRRLQCQDPLYCASEGGVVLEVQHFFNSTTKMGRKKAGIKAKTGTAFTDKKNNNNKDFSSTSSSSPLTLEATVQLLSMTRRVVSEPRICHLLMLASTGERKNKTTSTPSKDRVEAAEVKEEPTPMVVEKEKEKENFHNILQALESLTADVEAMIDTAALHSLPLPAGAAVATTTSSLSPVSASVSASASSLSSLLFRKEHVNGPRAEEGRKLLCHLKMFFK